MRRLFLIALLCLLPATAMATAHTVGAAGADKCDGNPCDFTSMVTCFTALGNGDTIDSYGPYGESNVTITSALGAAVTGVVWVHHGGDYTFDGTGGTGVFMALGAGNTGWTIEANDGTGRVVVTGYIGANPFVVTGASNTVGGFRLTANGAAGVAQVTAIATGNSVTLDDILIDNPVDPTNQNWTGIYLNGGSGNVVSGCTVEDVAITGATKNAFVVAMLPTTVAPTIDGLLARNMTATGQVKAVDAVGPAGGGYVTIQNSTVYGLASGTLGYSFLLYQRSGLLRSLLAYDITAQANQSQPIRIETAVVDPVLSDTIVENCTVVGGNYAITIVTPPTVGSRTVRNCISSGASVAEFYSGAGAVATSLNNCAATGKWSANFPNGATDLSVDCGFEDAANDDYSLAVDSVCIDSGLWIDGRTADLVGQHVPSGPAMDRGAYEYQQAGGRNVTTPLDGPVVVPTRNERNAR
jgi:hypothetical protein